MISYNCSICGRACDVACYCHLEEKGVLRRRFKTPFRYRGDWKFPLDDFVSAISADTAGSKRLDG